MHFYFFYKFYYPYPTYETHTGGTGRKGKMGNMIFFFINYWHSPHTTSSIFVFTASHWNERKESTSVNYGNIVAACSRVWSRRHGGLILRSNQIAMDCNILT